MINIETLVFVWPFFMIALAVGVVLLAHRFFDRRELQRRHPAE